MTWQSIHLFLADPARADAFLLETVGPTLDAFGLRGQPAGWFFIRYWEGGPHLRLRLAHMPDDACERLIACLAARFGHYLRADQILPDAYPAAMRFERPDVGAEARRWLPQGTIKRVPYQPEIVRYGGSHALAISERLFYRSSEIALQVLAATASAPARQTSALLLTSVALAAATSDRPALLAFLRGMKRTWGAILGDTRPFDAAAEQVALAPRRRYLDLIARLQAGGAAPAQHAGAWWNALQEAIADWRRLAAHGLLLCPLTARPVSGQPGLARALAALIDAHIHMMNNRLGLSPATEYWFAHMLADAADAADPDGEGAAAVLSAAGAPGGQRDVMAGPA